MRFSKKKHRRKHLLIDDGHSAPPTTSGIPRSGPRFLAGGRLGLALSVELKQPLSLGHHEKMTCLLLGGPLPQDLDGVLEVGGVGLLEHLLSDPRAGFRIEGGQDRLLLQVTMELLLAA